MAPELVILRIALLSMFLTLALMTWAYTVGAESSSLLGTGQRGNSLESFPHCAFNPLCTCSNPGPTDYGIVDCHGTPFGNIPQTLNNTRAFILSMVRNDLQVLEEKRLVGSGLWRLEIRENNLNHIADDALIGLSKSLWQLDFQNNELTAVPTAALRHLQRLQVLDLSQNKITDVHPEDFQGLQTSLTCLSLAGNLIVNVQEATFGRLSKLERLDLSGNSIQVIHNQAFGSMSRTLHYMALSNNLLQKIPFEAISSLSLKYLDMSHNLISTTYDIFFKGKVSVDHLSLEHNRIDSLEPFSFQNFRQATTVSLAYNPISIVVDDSFKDAEIDNLDLSNCFIHEIYPKAFRGLESSLKVLDLSFNNISHLTPDLFENFDRLRVLDLDENRLQFSPDEFDGFGYTLHRLSLIGDSMGAMPIEDIRLMRNLRSLNISNFGATALSSEMFQGFGPAVEKIKISQAKLTSIKGSAFIHLPGIKLIDLSGNRISGIENEAFQDIGHSLLRLRLSNSVKMSSISPQVLEKLTVLRELDISNNGLTKIAEDSFSKNEQLLYLNLRFNKISSIEPLLFDSAKVPRLQRLFMSFNNIGELKESTFSRLKRLEYIELNENAIHKIQKKAFEDVTNLRILNLAGNKLIELEDETFQNLPRLQNLDLSHNRITSFNINAFEQLGTLSLFRINMSYNKIQRLVPEGMDKTINNSRMVTNASGLTTTTTPRSHQPIYFSSSSIESIDLSHNNISFIYPQFFLPTGNTLIEVDLSYNRLQNLTKEHLFGMKFVQKFHVEHNLLDSVEYNTFRDSTFIQVIIFDHNQLRDIPPDLFEGCSNLRVFSTSNNKIRNLADSLFKDTQLEILNLKNNQLVRFPETALARVSNSIVRLDLSGNEISSLSPSMIECLQRLRWLSLANNRIVVIAEPTFDSLVNLLYLDLSGNPMGRLTSRIFEETKSSLLHLHVANMSLETLPEFDSFPKLLTFNTSFNKLTYLPTNFGVNVSNLRTLDISGNEISTPPNTIWHTIPRLSTVLMHSNIIRSLANDSFLQLDRLHELDISDLPLESVQVGVLSPLGCLKKVKMGPFPNTINPGAVIQTTESIQHLHLKLDTPTMSTELRSYPLPEKLANITLSGTQLMSIANGALQEVSSRTLKLIIENTGLSELPQGVLHSLGDASQLLLNFRGNNSALKTIKNPNNKFKPEPYSTYLYELDVDDNFRITCSCDSGWIEFWLRQWMEETCPVGSPTLKEEAIQCDAMLQSLRTVKCLDKPDLDLTDAFVSDLECGWESSASTLRDNYKQKSILLALLFTTLILLTL